nr:serine/threonine-protein kinase [Chiayiivirga flava]
MCAEVHPDLIADLRRALAPDDAVLPALGGLAAEVTRERPTDRRGLRAGAWRLLEKLGRGGMGTVYLAERADGAFDKRAAVKLLRGHDLRFKDQLERERRVLARLDHPHIARLLDGGVLPDGQPYLVMELADGEDLDDWLARARPSLEARLQVFLAICEAVAYAHGVLVVHRDLKPSNIRVAADGSVKLLDFGIAKLLAPDAERGNTQHLALTPDFAAPEQLQGGVISTRTDVYALGALLFLLLSGRAPHPAFDGNWAGFVQRITEDDARPVSSAATPDATLALAPATLRGDLDAIVAQALRREPVQRYPNVDAFAADVRRFLDGRPVHAHPPTLGYRARKWLRRRWGLAAAAGAVTLALVAGVSGIVWQARYTAAERDAAQLEARRSQAVRDYLLLMFRDAGAQAGDAQALSAKTVLEQAAAGIEREFADDPDARQQVLASLAEIYIYLGDFVAAEALLSRFLQLDDGRAPGALRAQVHSDLADVQLRRGNPVEACAEIETALSLLRAEPGDQRSAVGTALSLRGQCRRMSGALDAALADLREAVSLQRQARGATARETAAAHNSLAAGYLQAGALDAARTELEAALAVFEATGRGASVDAANTLNNLAVAAMLSGRMVQAQAWLQRALEVRRAASGESAALGALLVNYGRALTLLGRFDEAAPQLDEAIVLLERYTGADSIDSASAGLALADYQTTQRAYGGAERTAARSRDTLVAKLGAGHPASLRAAAQLAEIQWRRGDATSLARLQAAIAGLRESGASGASYLAAALCQSAIAQRTTSPEDALRDARECLSLRRARNGETHWETAQAALLVASLDPDNADGERDAAQAMGVLRDALGERSPRVIEAAAWMPR